MVAVSTRVAKTVYGRRAVSKKFSSLGLKKKEHPKHMFAPDVTIKHNVQGPAIANEEIV